MFRRSVLLLLALLLCGVSGLVSAASLTAGDIAGAVKDPKGKAIGNVRVRYSGPTEGSVRTDAAGKYLLSNLPPGTYELYFQKPGWLTVFKGSVAVVANQVTTLNVKLEWADNTVGSLEVRVEDRNTRSPLPETTLDLVQNGFPVLRTVADETGSVVLPGIAPGIYRVLARRPGFQDVTSADLQVRAGKPTAVTVRMLRNITEVGRLSGTVRDLSGSAISGARVKIIQGFGSGQVSTPATGRYEFTNLIPGNSYALEVSAAGFQTQVVGSIPVRSQALTVQDFNLVPALPSKGSITGRVTDSEGTAISLALVTITAGPGLGMEVLTGSDGRYLLSDLTPGAYALLAEADGFSSAGRSGLEVRAGLTQTVNFQLSFRTTPAGSLTGVVREAGSGLLLSGVVVEVLGGPSAGRATVTGADGSYLLTDLIPYESYTVRFRKSGYLTFSQPTLRIDPATRSTLNAQLTPEQAAAVGDLEGSVRRYGAGALAGVKVTVYQGPTSPLTTQSDTQGRFSFKNLKAGNGYAIRLEKKAYATTTRTNLTVTAGRVTRVSEVVMSRTADLSQLRVVVIDLAGRPILNAGVTITEGPSRPPRGTTNAQGRVAFDAILPGTYAVDVVANGYQNGRKGDIFVAAGRTQEVVVQLLR